MSLVRAVSGSGSVRTWVIASGAVMALAVLILAALGRTMAVQMRAAEHRAQITTDALRSHMEADMMHDTLRAEVYLAFYNSSQGNLAQRARQTTELARYAAWFRRSVLNSSGPRRR